MRWLLIPVGLLLLEWATGPISTRPPLSSSSLAGDLPVSARFPTGWQEHIAAREYWASQTPAGLQAPNRRHDLRSFFEPTGVRVHGRSQTDSPQLVQLRLTGLGRSDHLDRVSAGEVTHHEGRVEIRREAVVEWYENSESGLEQGFTLAERPAKSEPGALVLELSVLGSRASLRGDDVALATTAGRKLVYGQLEVVDANGDRLLAHFEVPRPDRVRLVTDDAQATYPIVIDPLLQETTDAFLEANQADAAFGYSVASAGDVNGDGYDDVIVGAYNYDAGQTDEGAAFVFLGSAGGMIAADPASAHAQLEGDYPGALMGRSVASAGDVNGDGYDDVIVGAPVWFNEGAALVFLGSASGIADGNPNTAHARLEGNQFLSSVGESVASAGDVNGDGYDDVIVGASSYSIMTFFVEGAAFVFLGSETGIASGGPAQAHAQFSGETASSRMGASVASAGDVNGDGYADVIVGAHAYSNGEVGEGGAFVFLGSAAGVASGSPASAHAVFEADQANARMGRSVASAGDVNGDGYDDVIVGAPKFQLGLVDVGAAFVFHGSAAGLVDGNPISAAASIESDQVAAELGTSVASAGDVNGDGYSDVVVGAPLYDAGQTDEGAAFVYLGSPMGVVGGAAYLAYAQLESNQANAQMGVSVAPAGDVNGDSYADVISGAAFLSSGQANEGAAFVYLGVGPLPPVIYREDFLGESSFPNTPEVDHFSVGGLDPETFSFSDDDVSLVLDGSVLNATVVAGSAPATDFAAVGLDASRIADRDFLLSARFEDFSHMSSNGTAQSFGVVAAFTTFDIRYQIDLFPGFEQVSAFYFSTQVGATPLPSAQALAIRSGSPFRLAMWPDPTADGVMIGAAFVDGFEPTFGPSADVTAGDDVMRVGVVMLFYPDVPGAEIRVNLTEIEVPEPGMPASLMTASALLLLLNRLRRRHTSFIR